MLLAQQWPDYELIDAGGGEKLERWGSVKLLRPDPQAVWPAGEWGEYDARYIRSSSGGGEWEWRREIPEQWTLSYADLTLIVKPTGFKHTGLFPEQAVNWDWARGLLAKAGQGARVLNLFAYTGAASCACAAQGAAVVHVDAAKGIVAWAKANAAASGVENSIRFLVDDVNKFVAREKRRGNKYDGIIMDPPSYGRGPGGEMWKIEDGLFELVAACAELLSPNPLFFLINSYTTGLSPSVLSNVMKLALPPGSITADEIGLRATGRELVLPCGATGRWSAAKG